MRIFISSILTLFLATATLQVNAQVVKTPGNSAYVVTNSNMPIRGLSKSQVETRFGQPSSKQGPVGNPSIYRWDYNNYSVFFESNIVIHAVAH
jgi:Mlc titration factor MtfA (ptsG expression regulator)